MCFWLKCVFDVFSFYWKRHSWFMLILPCRCVRYISIVEIGHFLHLFSISSPLKLGSRLSAFNNLHKFCSVLTFYAEQTFAKTQMTNFIPTTARSSLWIWEEEQIWLVKFEKSKFQMKKNVLNHILSIYGMRDNLNPPKAFQSRAFTRL